MIPELEIHCGSWIVSSKVTGKAVAEIYSRKLAEKVNQTRYIVETAQQYLARFNRELVK